MRSKRIRSDLQKTLDEIQAHLGIRGCEGRQVAKKVLKFLRENNFSFSVKEAVDLFLLMETSQTSTTSETSPPTSKYVVKGFLGMEGEPKKEEKAAQLVLEILENSQHQFDKLDLPRAVGLVKDLFNATPLNIVLNHNIMENRFGNEVLMEKVFTFTAEEFIRVFLSQTEDKVHERLLCMQLMHKAARTEEGRDWILQWHGGSFPYIAWEQGFASNEEIAKYAILMVYEFLKVAPENYKESLLLYRNKFFRILTRLSHCVLTNKPKTDLYCYRCAGDICSMCMCGDPYPHGGVGREKDAAVLEPMLDIVDKVLRVCKPSESVYLLKENLGMFVDLIYAQCHRGKVDRSCVEVIYSILDTKKPESDHVARYLMDMKVSVATYVMDMKQYRIDRFSGPVPNLENNVYLFIMKQYQ